VEPDRDLLAFYLEWIARRRQSAALRRGHFEILLTDDVGRVFAFRRDFESTSVVGVFNASDEETRLSLPQLKLKAQDGWRLDSASTSNEVRVAARWFSWLERDVPK
jgi:glycosidase